VLAAGHNWPQITLLSLRLVAEKLLPCSLNDQISVVA
jgi:hypothetical protein